METKKISFDDIRKNIQKLGYEVIKSIGKGAFGQVVLSRHSKFKTGSHHAIKIISKAKTKKSPYLQKYINQEVDIMKRLNHPNIVKLIQFTETKDFYCLVMEYCEHGNLLAYQAQLPGRVFQLQHAVKILIEVMKGLKWIHESTYVHRDIKSENILLKKQQTVNGYILRCKIADFGLARPITKDNDAKTFCGTQRYMAPEIINNSYYGISIDLWSLAVLFYFMLFAQYPFRSTELRNDIYKKCTPYFDLSKVISRKQKIRDTPAQVFDFFKQIFVIDFKNRITFSKIIKHPLFAKYAHQFEQNEAFYKNFEKNQKLVKIESNKTVEQEDELMEPEDESRIYVMRDQQIKCKKSGLNKYLEEINFQIQKVRYLAECSQQFFHNYSPYIVYIERLLAQFYLLRAFFFFCNPLLQSLLVGKIPVILCEETNVNQQIWKECIQTEEYRKMVKKLQQDQLRYQFIYEDTFGLIQSHIDFLPIAGIKNQLKMQLTQTSFQQFKQNYRIVTSYFFKLFNNKTEINPRLQVKILFRIFICHTINRIFNRKQLESKFPVYFQWLRNNKIQYSHSLDMGYFKQWILLENEEKLSGNLRLLYKAYF